MKIRTSIALFAFSIAAFFAGGAVAADEMISRPGEYRGYSAASYDNFGTDDADVTKYHLTSEYVTMRDGTTLAVDIIRPTVNGEVVDGEKYPVVWQYTAYNRRSTDGGLTARNYPGAALALVKYGYVVMTVDMRGSYASYGSGVTQRRIQWLDHAYWDAYDIMDWIVAQPWSDGSIGTWGCSATGHSQWQIAATKHPNLKAIFPLSAPSEYYEIGGIVKVQDSPANPPAWPSAFNEKEFNAAAPVGSDSDKSLLKAAVEEHRRNMEPGYLPYRDSIAPWPLILDKLEMKYHLVVNSIAHFAEIAESGVPIYQSANYEEDYRVKRGVIFKYNTLAETNPMKVVMGPGAHCQWCNEYNLDNPRADSDFRIDIEELRWFDYWLKGIDNGIMEEPPLYYATYGTPAEKEWRFAWQWPVPTDKQVNFYFGDAVDGNNPGSVFQGALSTTAPTAAEAKDEYLVDYDALAIGGEDNGKGTIVSKAEPQLSIDRNAHGMSYTTAPLESDVTLTGDPVLHLWISSTATDGDFLAFLYDVAPDGTPTQIPGSEDGQLRASHRKLNEAPYNNSGLPYHRSFEEDVEPLTPGEPVELSFDMAPMSYIFKAGHRIRLVMTCVGIGRHREGVYTPQLEDETTVRFYRDTEHPSYITLPMNEPVVAEVAANMEGETIAAAITFPDTLNSKYIQDVKIGSIRCNGEPALSAQVENDTVAAVCSASAVRQGGEMLITGTFGDTYYYGDEMTFYAEGNLRQ